jgi:hypothetical protein
MENTPRSNPKSQNKELKYHNQNLDAEDLFTVFGYFKEYWVAGKFLGIKDCEKPENNVYGYYSKRSEIAEEDIILKNGNKIPKGHKYYTRSYPFCGKKK